MLQKSVKRQGVVQTLEIEAQHVRRLIHAFIIIATCSPAWTAWGQTPAAPLPSTDVLYTKLDSLVRRLRSVQIVSADRSETPSPALGSEPLIIRWHDLFIDGDFAQARSNSVFAEEGNWWESKSVLKNPLTSSQLLDLTGVVYCHRPEGEWCDAEIVRMPDEKKLPYKILYAAHSMPRALSNFCLPFVGLYRDWKRPETPLGDGTLLVDTLCGTKPETWSNVRRELKDGASTIRVTVTLNSTPFKVKLARHPGEIEISTVLYAWFTDDQHSFPIRVESGREYRYQGADIDIRYEIEGRPGPVFTATDYTDYGNSLWYPQTGTQVDYVADLKSPKVTIDDILDEFQKNGFFVMKSGFVANLTRTWKTITMADLPPQTELWIDPPDGACLHKVSAGVEVIVGKSLEESAEIMGRRATSPLAKPVAQSPARFSTTFWVNIAVLLSIALIAIYRNWARRRS